MILANLQAKSKMSMKKINKKEFQRNENGQNQIIILEKNPKL